MRRRLVSGRGALEVDSFPFTRSSWLGWVLFLPSLVTCFMAFQEITPGEGLPTFWADVRGGIICESLLDYLSWWDGQGGQMGIRFLRWRLKFSRRLKAFGHWSHLNKAEESGECTPGEAPSSVRREDSGLVESVANVGRVSS